jgi:hypothetical protein
MSPVRVIESAAWTKRGPWTSMIVVLFAARFLRRKAKRPAQVLAIDKLEPGQGIIITTAPWTSRRA